MQRIDQREILETIRMIQMDKLDIRTITMGISLRDCGCESMEKTAQRVYDKITRYAKDLVKTGETIENELGIPIVNKRISVTPVSMFAESTHADGYVAVAQAMDAAAKAVGVNYIGGYSALVHKGFTEGDRALLRSIPDALVHTERVCASVNVATTKTGINMDAVRQMGEIIKQCAERTAEQDGIAASKLVVFSNAVEDNPFMAGAFHGVGEPECVINVGISGPGVVKTALEQVSGEPFDVVAETIKKDGLPHHAGGPARGARGEQAPGRAVWHRGPLAGPDAGSGRQRGAHPHGDGPGNGGRAGHYGGAGAVERCGEKGRRHGVQPCRRPERGVYPGQRGHRDDRGGARRRADAGKAGGHDVRVLGRPGYDRSARRHQRGDAFGHHCRRGGHRHDQPKDHGGAHHSGARQARGRSGGVWRPVWTRVLYGRQPLWL